MALTAPGRSRVLLLVGMVRTILYWASVVVLGATRTDTIRRASTSVLSRTDPSAGSKTAFIVLGLSIGAVGHALRADFRVTRRGLVLWYAFPFFAVYFVLRAEGLSPTTVLHHHRLLSTALRAAERQDMIVRNPTAIVEAPRRVALQHSRGRKVRQPVPLRGPRRCWGRSIQTFSCPNRVVIFCGVNGTPVSGHQALARCLAARINGVPRIDPHDTFISVQTRGSRCFRAGGGRHMRP